MQILAALLFIGLALLFILVARYLPAAAAGRFLRLLLAVCLALNGVLFGCIAKLAKETSTGVGAAVRAARMEEQSALVQALRVQRHEFANHLQVIAGLAQLGKSGRLLSYIQEIATSNAGLNAYGAVIQPEIKTVLLAKAYVAEACGLRLDLVTETDLADFPLDAGKVSSFLGCVLDSLLAQAEDSPERADGFTIQISENNGFFSIAVLGAQERLESFIRAPLPPGRRQKVASPDLPTAAEWIRREFGGTLNFVAVSDGEAKIVLRFPKPQPRGAVGE